MIVSKIVVGEADLTFTEYLGESLLCDLEPALDGTRLIKFAPRPSSFRLGQQPS
jgi:hypothetical protein